MTARSIPGTRIRSTPGTIPHPRPGSDAVASDDVHAALLDDLIRRTRRRHADRGARHRQDHVRPPSAERSRRSRQDRRLHRRRRRPIDHRPARLRRTPPRAAPRPTLHDLHLADAVQFVGSITPEGLVLQQVVATAALVDLARSEVDLVVVDTTGVVSGVIGQTLKYHKMELCRPDVVVGLQRGAELDPVVGHAAPLLHGRRRGGLRSTPTSGPCPRDRSESQPGPPAFEAPSPNRCNGGGSAPPCSPRPSPPVST